MSPAAGRLPAILLTLSLLYLGLLGIASADFGHHWDEPKLIESIQRSAQGGVFLPGWYNYPSVCYGVGLAVAAPHALMRWLQGHEDPGPVLVEVLGGKEFRLELRSIFFLLSTLGGVAVYFLVRRLAGNAWIALFAALTLLTSWEFTYHARWIAPDCVLAQFVSWSLLVQYGILKSETRHQRLRLALGASVLAGLCAGTKFTGGIIVVPLLLAVVATGKSWDAGRLQTFRLAGLCLLAAGATFVLTTPGSLLEPSAFVRDLRTEVAHYGRVGHGGYTVAPGWEHLSKMSIWLVAVLLSENGVLAVGVSILAVVGVASLRRESPALRLWLLSLPVLYMIYMSAQKVMIVRNYLLLLPFLSVFAALGLSSLNSLTKSRPLLRFLLSGVAASVILFNMAMATESSLSIAFRNTLPKQDALRQRLASSPGTRFFLSPEVRKLLDADSPAGHGNPDIVDSPRLAERFIYFSSEVKDRKVLRANVPGRYRTLWAEVQEVNWDYYPSWAGHPRVLEISAQDPALGPLRDAICGIR